MSEKCVCALCGKEYERDEMYLSPDGEFICEECHDCNVAVCDDCGCEYWADDMYNVHMDDGSIHLICGDCISNYSCCDDCGEYFQSVTWRDDECYCDDCIVNHPVQLVDQYNPIEDYHAHHGNEPIFFNLPDEHNEPFFGIELEVDSRDGSCSDNDNTALSIAEIMPEQFIYFENDGSLDEGFENITQPATLAYHTSIKDKYKEMFRTIVRSGLRSHQTGTCGLHVHFNRDFFSPENEELCVARLLYMVENFWDKMVIFSRRNNSNLERWSKKYNEDVNDVAKRWKDGYYGRHDDRYYAVNLTNRKTIEFRMFRGTLKWNTFIATIQLCYNLVQTAKNKPVNEIQTMKFEELINTPELKKYWIEACARKHITLNDNLEEVTEEVVSGDVVDESAIED